MITPEDLTDFCDLSPEEIEVIAECTNEPWVLSIAHGETLLCCEDGVTTIRHYFLEDIKHAEQRGDFKRAHALKRTYRAFKRSHAA